MFSVVLATMMTTGTAAPAWGLRGCHGCHGCSGYSCAGCYGCYGCYGGGGYGCGGCTGGCSGWSCWGGAWSGYGCHGCSGYGCYGSYYGCSGCHGCYGGHASYYGHESHGYAAVAAQQPATLQVSLPADAALTVEGQTSKQTTPVRTLVTPALAAGQEYVYTLKAEVMRDGKPVTESKDVRFRAGDMVKVEFGKLSALEVTSTAGR